MEEYFPPKEVAAGSNPVRDAFTVEMSRRNPMARMMGRIHDPQCDCNIEQYVSGADEKCNRRYGVKRQRAREKKTWETEARETEDGSI